MAGSTVDILARLKLNGQNFTSELQRELGNAERKFGQTGNVIGRNISQGIGGGLQQAAGRVPVLGGALSGLSGPALIAAGGVGAIVTALSVGISEAETLGREIRKLDAVIGNGENRTGFSRKQLIDYSDEMEGRLAIAQEEIIKTQAVLAEFDGVAGNTFKRVMEASADMSAAWGGDLAGNAEKLAVVIQNLTQGSVANLSKGFKKLGPDTLEAIESLAKMGKESEAIELLLGKLEGRIGSSAEAEAKGVTPAFFRMKDAVGDVAREFVESTGLYDGFAEVLDQIAESADGAAANLSAMGKAEAANRALMLLVPGMAPLTMMSGGRSGAQPRPLDPWSNDQWKEWSEQVKAEADADRNAKAAKARNARDRAEEAAAKAPKLNFDQEAQARTRGDLMTAASRYQGMNERGDKGALMALFREANLSVDPEMVKWCAAFVNAVLATQGLGGTGKLNARSFLEYGQASTDPKRGDVVVLQRGRNQDEGHVGFFEGFDRKGNVRVLGGNQSDGVNVKSFPRSDVLGFRSPPGAADAAVAQAKADQDRLKAQQEILATSREQLNLAYDEQRYAGMRLIGLEREAALEQELDRIRKESAEALAKLPEAVAEAESKVNDEAAEHIRLYSEQAALLAELVQANGDRATRTKEEVAAEQAAQQALQATMADAVQFTKTLAEQAALREAMVTAQHRLNAAAEDGAKTDKEAKEAAAERKAAMEDWLEADQKARKEAFDAQQDQIQDLASFYERAMRSGGKSIVEDFKDQMLGSIAQIAAQWTMALLSGQKVSFGSLLQQMGATSNGGGFNLMSLFGGGGSAGSGAAPGAGGAAGLGSMIPGLGDTSSIAGAQGATGLAGKLSSAMPYVGAAMAVMGVLGIDPIGEIKKLVSGTKRGSATLGFDSYGELGVGSSRGNSSSRISAAKGGIDSVAETIGRIADALGGDVLGFGSVSLGMRDGKWRGDPTGKGITKTKNGAIDFGDDQEAAIRWAVGEALRDGVVGGISDAAKKILASGQELERAIEKAAMIEDIPKRLMAALDPVGAALDEFHKGWAKQIAALEEGGATAEQMADAHKLYRLELEDVKAATQEASAGLKDFLNSLNFGSASPYSIRDQERMARESLQPYLDKIAAGERIDQDKYRAAASGFLEIERELYGSTGKYFEAMDMIQAATGKAISEIDNAKPIRTFADPFIEKTATFTEASANILDQVNGQMTEQGETLKAILDALKAGGAGFVGGGRGFSERVAN